MNSPWKVCGSAVAGKNTKKKERGNESTGLFFSREEWNVLFPGGLCSWPSLSLPVAMTPIPPSVLGHQSWHGWLLVPGGQGPQACAAVSSSLMCSWDLPAAGHSVVVLMLKRAEWLIHSWHHWGPWAHHIIKGRRINRNRGVEQTSGTCCLPHIFGETKGPGQPTVPGFLPFQPFHLHSQLWASASPKHARTVEAALLKVFLVHPNLNLHPRAFSQR